MRFLLTLNVRRAPNISGSFSWDGDVSCKKKQKVLFFVTQPFTIDFSFCLSFCSSADNPYLNLD